MINFSAGDILAIVGNPMAISVLSGLPVTRQNPSADADATALVFAADAGFYDLHSLRYKRSTCGIVETRVNGVLVDTWDGYHAGDVLDEHVISDIALNGGENIITYTINGANVSSFGHFAFYSSQWLIPR